MRNARGRTPLRGPEVLKPLRGLGFSPIASAIRGLRHLRGPVYPNGP